jgi:hypothetical protein
MFARKVHVEVVENGALRDCPIVWLDSFCMRSFTGPSAFDATLPVADGRLELGFQVDLEALQAELEEWMTRKFGGGSPVHLRLTEEQATASDKPRSD